MISAREIIHISERILDGSGSTHSGRVHHLGEGTRNPLRDQPRVLDEIGIDVQTEIDTIVFIIPGTYDSRCVS